MTPEFAICLTLLIFSILDMFFKEIPSFILTASLIIIFIYFQPFLFIIILALLFTLLFWDLTVYTGMADAKILILVLITLAHLRPFLIYIGLISVGAVIYKLIYAKLLKKEKTLPFIPLFLVCYIILQLIKYLGGI